MEIVVASQNVSRGGIRSGSGDPQDRWPVIAEALASVSPDIVLIQEAEGWGADAARQLVRAENDLDMDGILSPSRTGLGPALLYRRETLGRRQYVNSDSSIDETHHGYTTVGWSLPPALPALLCAGSVHFTPYDATKAKQEANFVASRVHRAGGGYAILGGT
ncbi:hypothetical protein C3486_02080 [Streptomyces sp. Ru73]|uniref:endonuclease/exonuclease/phosphatase family protein n=1 Tax=Streptomyces sp. Ru73 TaxID=2080748 RepID=UPI000CDE1F05|nr:endonuclease/exonuclease/phosphatase family protein [Streptomyces sp. Ru73]POX43031.1 hypothetical protein C3486_02080 [Streptomyces sp. Ru73]